MRPNLSRYPLVTSFTSSVFTCSTFIAPVFSGIPKPIITNENNNNIYISAAGENTFLRSAGNLGFGYDFGDLRLELGYTKSGGNIYGQIPINIETKSTI